MGSVVIQYNWVGKVVVPVQQTYHLCNYACIIVEVEIHACKFDETNVNMWKFYYVCNFDDNNVIEKNPGAHGKIKRLKYTLLWQNN